MNPHTRRLRKHRRKERVRQAEFTRRMTARAKAAARKAPPPPAAMTGGRLLAAMLSRGIKT